MRDDPTLRSRAATRSPLSSPPYVTAQTASIKEPDSTDQDDAALQELLARIQRLTEKPTATPARGQSSAISAAARAATAEDTFVPRVKGSLKEMGLTETEVESLILKFLLARGDAFGRDIAEQIKLPFCLVEGLLRQMKMDQLVVYRSANELNDYLYQLTDLGRERARRLAQVCTYFGAAPVSLDEYVESVEKQSLNRQQPKPEDFRRAFADLVIHPAMFNRLGPAVTAGRGLFLYGPPGNGKTSIAKRICQVFGKTIWVPRAISIDGEIVRVFDPYKHREMALPSSGSLLEDQSIDRRWVRVQRPTIVVGGELTMAHLEITENPATHVCEAPLQMKANCGILVIDDFGRQRIRIDELLNRWIVPLEERIDFLSLPSGKTIQVPFDQLIIFSTNLEPRELVDEAFLRRIPYKLEITNPSEQEFRRIFRATADQLGISCSDDAVTYLIEKHYRAAGRSFRCCHPRDLLHQVKSYCNYTGLPCEVKPEYLDLAVENYFSIM